jgi:hypothetical protein
LTRTACRLSLWSSSIGSASSALTSILFCRWSGGLWLPSVVEEDKGWFEVVDRWFADDVAGEAKLIGLAAELSCHLLGCSDEQVRRGREVLGRCAR